MLINKREFLLIRYCLDNAMVNLHADTKKIAVQAISKLEKQLKFYVKMEQKNLIIFIHQ